MSRKNITLNNSEGIEALQLARETVAKQRGVPEENLSHVEVAKLGFDLITNGRSPPIRRFLTSSRVQELRVEIADDLETDPLHIPPLAAVSDAVSYRFGAPCSLDFKPPDAASIDGFEQAAELAGADPAAPAEAIAAIVDDYSRLKQREHKLKADGGGAAYGGQGWRD